MIQVYKLILWSQAKEIDINEMTNISYDMLNILKDYGDELNPKYLPVKKKSLAKEFEFCKNSILKLLEKNVNKEGDLVFYDLGRIISFFTSLNDDESSGIMIKIGVSNNNFHNTCVINLAKGFSGINVRKQEFEILFKKLVNIFKPYWGCVSNNRNVVDFDYCYWGNDKPLTLHWMNYFDDSTAQNIGRDRILALNGIERLENGYYYKLQDEPLDVENHEHMLRQREVSKSLRLT